MNDLGVLNASSSDIAHFYRMKARAAQRDGRMHLIREVRNGNMRALFPDRLTEALGHEGIAVANFVDVVARDLAEVIAPLPSLACASGQMRTDADKRRAQMKNRIGASYWKNSNLDIQMLQAADGYNTYGFVPFFIEPDYKRKSPIIQADDSIGAYYERDRFREVSLYAKSWWHTEDELAAMYPEYEYVIRSKKDPRKGGSSGQALIELVRWVDDKSVALFLPERDGIVLAMYSHLMDCPPVAVVERPGLHEHARGQFDDVLYVQLARAIMGGLQLEAAQLAVEAPIAIPDDVQELPVGPNAIIQTAQPQNVRRIGLEVPPSTFQESAMLDNEMQVGSRYPDARLGQAQASVITGRGVEALMGGFDTQIKAGQGAFTDGLKRATAKCFEMDEILWPNTPKTIRGTSSGRTYEVSYTPKSAIAGNYECDVTYGFAAGMSPQQSIVTMLQLRGDDVISRDTFRENLPFDVDVVNEQSLVDESALRDGVRQGITSLAQAAGQMAAQGQDPSAMLLAVGSIIKARQGGSSIEDAAEAAFTKMASDAAVAAQAAQQQQMQQAQDQAAQQAQAGPPGGAPGGAPADPNAPQGGPPGTGSGGPQLPQPATSLPAIQSMVAGFRGGKAVMDESVRRQPLVGQ